MTGSLPEPGLLQSAWRFSRGVIVGIGEGGTAAAQGTYDLLKMSAQGYQELGKLGQAIYKDPELGTAVWDEIKDRSKGLADRVGAYGQDVATDPNKLIKDAKDGALALRNAAQKVLEEERKAYADAKARGEGSDFIGQMIGRVGFEAATLVVGVGAASKANKALKARSRVGAVAEECLPCGKVGTTPSAVIPTKVAAAKGSAAWFDDVARAATRNPGSDKLILGQFAREGVSYEKVAAKSNATFFQVDDWTAVTKGLSQDDIWKINETFLSQQIKQGKQVLFSHNPKQPRVGSYFEKEVTYLEDLGYTFKQIDPNTWEAVR